MLALLFPAFATAGTSPEQAAREPSWQRLLHLDGNGRSRIDSPTAFLVPGAGNPAQEELRAALEVMAAPEESADYQCRFPARVAYLRQTFPQRARDWPQVDCPQYQAWRERLAVRHVTLVFASAYLSNPSSMFGHTLLRLDGEGRSPLLSWAVNFAAQTRDRQGLSYAWKGMTGGYVGKFGIYPYYEKVREYARIENRDLWEYELRLSEAELERLLAHLWELRELGFDYYFFDENCSFQLLALLEVARPDLDLTSGFGVWAAPVDTVRRLRAQPDLVGAVRYRPALQTRIAEQVDHLSPAVQQHLAELLAGRQQQPAAALAAQDRARLAELVHDWAWYQLQNTAWISGAPAASRRQWLQELRERALAWRRALPAEPVFAPATAPASPDTGPGSQRLSLGGSWQLAERGAALLGWRPVLRDLLEPPLGWDANAAIEVLDLQLSLARGRLRPRHLRLIEIESRPPRDRWFSPRAWQLAAGYTRPVLSGPGWGQLRGGLGGSWQGGRSWQLDAQAVAELLLGPHWDRAAAAGLEVGLRGQIGRSGQWRLRAQSQRLLAHAGRRASERQWRDTRDWFEFGQQWRLAAGWGLRLQARRYPSADVEGIDLLLQRYF